MPIYEYECLNNKHRFEVIQKFADPPVTLCTVCGEPVQKLPSSPAIQFKGTGWYITDYARKGESSSEKSESKGSDPKNSESKNSESKSSESKPSSESASTEKTSNDSSAKSTTKDKS